MWLYLSEVDKLYFWLGWRGAVFFPQAVVSGSIMGTLFTMSVAALLVVGAQFWYIIIV
jgi:hypothetical protein